MTQTRYMIKEASKIIRIQPHVLRYWEEELNLDIPRNEMGHRFYRKEDLELFREINLLRTKGFSLKGIRLLMPDMERVRNLDDLGLDILKDEIDKRVQELELRETQSLPVLSVPADETSSQSVTEEVSEIAPPAKLLMEKLSLEPENKLQQFEQIISGIINKLLLENNERITNRIKDDVTDNILKEVDYMLRTQQEQQDEQFQKLLEVFGQAAKSRREAAAAGHRQKKLFQK